MILFSKWKCPVLAFGQPGSECNRPFPRYGWLNANVSRIFQSLAFKHNKTKSCSWVIEIGESMIIGKRDIGKHRRLSCLWINRMLGKDCYTCQSIIYFRSWLFCRQWHCKVKKKSSHWTALLYFKIPEVDASWICLTIYNGFKHGTTLWKERLHPLLIALGHLRF